MKPIHLNIIHIFASNNHKEHTMSGRKFKKKRDSPTDNIAFEYVMNASHFSFSEIFKEQHSINLVLHKN